MTDREEDIIIWIVIPIVAMVSPILFTLAIAIAFFIGHLLGII